MLSNIYIKNFAIIDEIEIDFHENMSVLTGETGAGKSILIDAINIVFGNKKIKKISRNVNKDTEIICHFNIKNKNVLGLLKEKDLAESNECIFRRKINTKNTSKIYINDNPVASSTAKEIGELIIDIHGQHENQLILSNDEQRNRLDNFSGLLSDKDKIKEILSSINEIKQSLSSETYSNEEFNEKVSLLEFEIKELSDEVIKPIAYESLSEEYKKLSNSEFLMNKVKECENMLENDNNSDIKSLLSLINRNLEEIQNIDENTQDIYDLNIQILDQATNLKKSFEKYSRSISDDPERLSFLDQKILLLNNLSRKYNVTEKELYSVLENKIKILEKKIKKSKSARKS